MTARPPITARVTAALEHLGQGTYQDLADWADLPHSPVRRALARMSSEPRATRRAHIKRYTLAADGQREYPRPVYAPGPGPNARRPAPKPHSQRQRESNQRAERLLSTVYIGISQRKAKVLRAKLRRVQT